MIRIIGYKTNLVAKEIVNVKGTFNFLYSVYLGETLGNDPRIKFDVLTILSDMFYENEIAIGLVNEFSLNSIELVMNKFISDYGESISEIKTLIISILTNFLKTFSVFKAKEIEYSLDNIAYFLIGIMTSEFSNYRDIYEIIEFFTSIMSNENNTDEIKSLLVEEKRKQEMELNSFTNQNMYMNCAIISKLIYILISKRYEIVDRLICYGIYSDKARIKGEILVYLRYMIYYIDFFRFDNFILELQSFYNFLESCLRKANTNKIMSESSFKFKLVQNSLKTIISAYNYTTNYYDIQKMARNFFLEKEQDGTLLDILMNRENDFRIKYLILQFFKELIEQNDIDLNKYLLIKSELVHICFEEVPKSDSVIQYYQCFILDQLCLLDENNSKFGLGFEIQMQGGELMRRIDKILTYDSTDYRLFFEKFQNKYTNFVK